MWLESGLGYRRDYADSSASLSPLPRGGVRLTHELWPRKSLYLAAAYDGAVTVDAGGWFGFAPKATDLYGFNAAMGAGVSYVGGAWGATLSAAVRYELLPDVDLQLVYTHRPIFFPELSQAFDVSLGVGFDLAAPEPLAEPTPPQRAP